MKLDDRSIADTREVSAQSEAVFCRVFAPVVGTGGKEGNSCFGTV